mmetsp:Transcript_29534/g.96495  ORF Transcript_29534/g.96495 Transcript_29534/m.96495 type:complete len:410 (-) Transcript_29534:788-2017(-)
MGGRAGAGAGHDGSAAHGRCGERADAEPHVHAGPQVPRGAGRGVRVGGAPRAGHPAPRQAVRVQPATPRSGGGRDGSGECCDGATAAHVWRALRCGSQHRQAGQRADGRQHVLHGGGLGAGRPPCAGVPSRGHLPEPRVPRRGSGRRGRRGRRRGCCGWCCWCCVDWGIPPGAAVLLAGRERARRRAGGCGWDIWRRVWRRDAVLSRLLAGVHADGAEPSAGRGCPDATAVAHVSRLVHAHGAAAAQHGRPDGSAGEPYQIGQAAVVVVAAGRIARGAGDGRGALAAAQLGGVSARGASRWAGSVRGRSVGQGERHGGGEPGEEADVGGSCDCAAGDSWRGRRGWRGSPPAEAQRRSGVPHAEELERAVGVSVRRGGVWRRSVVGVASGDGGSWRPLRVLRDGAVRDGR